VFLVNLKSIRTVRNYFHKALAYSRIFPRVFKGAGIKIFHLVPP
jgi:hypothetical protein